MYLKNLLRIATAGLSVATTVVTAQTVANGPYYATPSWDQTLPVASRFIVLANFSSDAVLDRETGLVWSRSPQAGASNLLGAELKCIGSNRGGRSGWRLPTFPELHSLFDVAAPRLPQFVLNTFLPAGHPFTGFPTGAVVFWTTTTYAGRTEYLQFGYTFTAPEFTYQPSFISVNSLAENGYAWCVRGPA